MKFPHEGSNLMFQVKGSKVKDSKQTKSRQDSKVKVPTKLKHFKVKSDQVGFQGSQSFIPQTVYGFRVLS